MTDFVHDIQETIARVADQRMRQIEMLTAVEERVSREHLHPRKIEAIHPYLAISSEAGAGGSEIASRVASLLGWRLLDRELLDYVAGISHVSASSLERLDEKNCSWIGEMLGPLFDRQRISQIEFMNRMTSALWTAARQESIVVVGRGARFILPAPRGIAVRIVAPLKQRLLRIQQKRRMTRAEAAQYIARTDRERQAFIERFFHHNIADPHLFDYVINAERLNPDAAAEMLVRFCRERFSETPVESFA